MRINQDNHSELHATLQIWIEPSDYQETVNTTLKQVAKQQNFPGFRPGKAPLEVVKQKYELSVRMEEVEKLLNRTLNEHVEKNHLDLLTRAIEVEAKEEEKGHYFFAYEMGWSPNLALDIEKEIFTYYQLEIDGKKIQRYIKGLALENAKTEETEQVTENSYVFVNVFEENGTEPVKNTQFFVGDLTEEGQKILIGKAKNTRFAIQLSDLGKDTEDQAICMRASEAELATFKQHIEMEIHHIKAVELPEWTTELVEKITGKNVATEEINQTLAVYAKEQLHQQTVGQLDRVFYDFATHQLLNKYTIALPEAFLKRQLETDANMTPELLAKEFPAFLKQMRVHVLHKALVKKGNLQLHIKDLEDEYKAGIYRNLGGHFSESLVPLIEKMAQDEIQKLLKSQKEEDRKQRDELQENAIQHKILNYLKTTGQLQIQEVSGEFLTQKIKELEAEYSV